MAMKGEVEAGQPDAELKEVRNWLFRYGYLERIPTSDAMDEQTREALGNFHAFYGFPELEKAITPRTLGFVRETRCGVKDWEVSGQLRGCRWPPGQRDLVYAFGRETLDVGPSEGFDAVSEAIELWNLELEDFGIPLFIRPRNETDSLIYVHFEWRVNDRDLNMRGEPIAHADFPPSCGRISNSLPRPVHFDDSGEHRWTRDPASGNFDIASVAMHEIGHIIGLPHLPGRNHLMSPELDAGEERLDLTEEDERALVELYSPGGRRDISGLGFE